MAAFSVEVRGRVRIGVRVGVGVRVMVRVGVGVKVHVTSTLPQFSRGPGMRVEGGGRHAS